jgi:hypothetical protein
VNHKCFILGELIIGLSQENENWWYGRIGARDGMFPVNYVWQLDSKVLKVSENILVLDVKLSLFSECCMISSVIFHTYSPTKMGQSVPKHWHLNYSC